MPRKTFFIKTIFLYCLPCLSKGSKGIFIKNIFLFPKVVKGEGQSLGDMSPKSRVFY